MTKTIYVTGMSCGHCVQRVKNALGSIDGVTDVTVNLEEKRVVLQSNQEITNEVLIEVIDDAGYDVTEIQ